MADARNSTFTLIEDVEIYGGYPAGGGTRDPDANPTILSGDLDQDGTAANNAYHVLWGGSSISAAVVLDGFTITAGNANGGSGIQKRGGGIYCDSASPQFVSCAFEGNRADIRSGACHLEGSSDPSFLDCRFISNVSALQGGAIFCERSSQPSFEECQFISNSAVASAGALRIDSSQVVQVDKCVFSGNSVTNGSGGAIFTVGSSPTFTQCVFSGNSATGSGGGIHFFEGSAPVLTSCHDLGKLGGPIWRRNL